MFRERKIFLFTCVFISSSNAPFLSTDTNNMKNDNLKVKDKYNNMGYVTTNFYIAIMKLLLQILFLLKFYQ
jgi:hypothetical protein